MEFEIRDSKNFVAMGKLRTAIIRFPDRWTDARVRDQFPEAVQTDMLIGLQMMRAGGEIPADKPDFDKLVGGIPKFLCRPDGPDDTMAEMIGSFLTMMHRDYNGRPLSGLAGKNAKDDTVLTMPTN